MWTYKLRFVKCGKPGCKRDESGGHGPYWYAYEHRGGRMYARYVGKRPPDSWQNAATTVEAPPLDKRWVFNGRMDLRTALRIFGLDKMPNMATLQARYRTLALENHPDRGGDVRVMAAINRAYGYLKL